MLALGTRENDAVVTWLRQNSQRRVEALRVWSKLFTALHPETGEIMLTRQELAERVGIAPRAVSSIMTELEGIGAISRRRDGRGVRCFLSPWVATHLIGRARDAAQAAARPLELELATAESPRSARRW